MLRLRHYDPQDPNKPRVRNEPPEWSYWNRVLVDLDEAICLTLNIDPKSYYSDSSNSRTYNNLYDYANSSISDGSLQYQNKFTGEKFRAVDWLKWLEMMELHAPDEWLPVGSNRGDDSSESANAYEARYKPNYEEAVDIAIAMAESNELSTPTCLAQLYYHMETHMNDCPVNYGSAKKPKMATVEKYVRSGGVIYMLRPF